MIPGDIEDGRRGANAEDRLEALEIYTVPGRLNTDVSSESKEGEFRIPEVIFQKLINLEVKIRLRDKGQKEKKGRRGE